MPTADTSGWKSDGPNIAAPPKTTEYRDIALGSCSFGTSDATIAPRVGISNASMTPVTAEIAKRCHATITSVAINTAVTNPAIANRNRVNLSSRSRFTVSATTPPQTEKTITGAIVAAVTDPSRISESVSERISHSRP